MERGGANYGASSRRASSLVYNVYSLSQNPRSQRQVGQFPKHTATCWNWDRMGSSGFEKLASFVKTLKIVSY